MKSCVQPEVQKNADMLEEIQQVTRVVRESSVVGTREEAERMAEEERSYCFL